MRVQKAQADKCVCGRAGVLQVEAMAQLGGIVMLDPEAPAKEQFFFGGIEKCRFKKPVVPGDTLVPFSFFDSGYITR